MSKEAELEALLEIINTSTRQAIAEYKKAGNGVPTISSAEFHPLDSSLHNVALRKATRLLEGACQQLCASLTSPQYTVLNLVQRYDSACIDVALRKGIADVLDNYPDGLHVNELSQVVGIERTKLARILRLLTSKGIFTEVDRDVFSNNRLSLVIKNTSNAGYLMRLLMPELTHQAGSALYDALNDPEYGASRNLDKSVMRYVLKQQGMEDYKPLEMDEEMHGKFHKAMIGLGEFTGSLSVIHHYPWDVVNTVCDVGASMGTFSIPLAKAYTHLKITNQDLETVMPLARDVWEREAPKALQEGRIDFVPLDFLNEAPVAGMDVYYLRFILYNWPDAEVLTILRNVRKAMAPHSRLLIHDQFVAGANTRIEGINIVPAPMLPIFGGGNVLQNDLAMLLFCNGMGHHVDDLIDLATAAGLRLEKADDLGETAVLDFRVA